MELSLDQINKDIARLKGEFNFEAKRISHPFYTRQMKSTDTDAIQKSKMKLHGLLHELRVLQKKQSKLLTERN
jgi:hypothetical protein